MSNSFVNRNRYFIFAFILLIIAVNLAMDKHMGVVQSIKTQKKKKFYKMKNEKKSILRQETIQ